METMGKPLVDSMMIIIKRKTGLSIVALRDSVATTVLFFFLKCSLKLDGFHCAMECLVVLITWLPIPFEGWTILKSDFFSKSCNLSFFCLNISTIQHSSPKSRDISDRDVIGRSDLFVGNRSGKKESKTIFKKFLLVINDRKKSKNWFFFFIILQKPSQPSTLSLGKPFLGKKNLIDLIAILYLLVFIDLGKSNNETKIYTFLVLIQTY